MSAQDCSACGRLIEVEPAACPACGKTQPGPEVRGRRRAFLGMCTLAGAALLGALVGKLAQAPRARVLSPAAEAEDGARRRLRAAWEELGRDAQHPRAEIEDALARPADFAGRRGAILALVLPAPGDAGAERAEAVSYWPLGPRLEVDASALPPEAKAALARHDMSRPGWAALRGSWRAGGLARPGRIHFAATGFEPLGSAPHKTLEELLAGPE